MDYREGTVTAVKMNERGEYTYGFITSTADEKEDNCFFHKTSLIGCSIDELKKGDKVKFRLGVGNNGKEQALDVEKYNPVTSEEPDVPPAICSVLIVSLSTFPANGNLSPCRYFYLQNGAAAESGEYFCQQEPFPMRLRQELCGGGEIIMLTTEAARAETKVVFQDETLQTSPMDFFIARVRSVPGLETIRFQAVDLDEKSPETAIREVVEHLRSIKMQGAVPRVYLGTNGGLRGIQLILEAILSLLSLEGIRVEPEYVWSMRQLSGGEWELYSGAAEFRIFDFAAGISEFLLHGRMDSLESFLRTNPGHMEDGVTAELLDGLREVSEGIQFCSTKTYEAGLDRLTAFFREERPIGDPYAEMFRASIRDDFGPLLREGRRVLDEVLWCWRKGFYQQAFTLVESALPRELFAMGIIGYDEIALAAVEQPEWWIGAMETPLFNAVVPKMAYMVEQKPWLANNEFLYINNVGRKLVTLTVSFRRVGQTQGLRALLKQHAEIKFIRNKLAHGGEGPEDTTGAYRDALEKYLQRAESVYAAWERNGRNQPPLMTIRG